MSTTLLNALNVTLLDFDLQSSRRSQLTPSEHEQREKEQHVPFSRFMSPAKIQPRSTTTTARVPLQGAGCFSTYSLTPSIFTDFKMKLLLKQDSKIAGC